MPPVQSDGQIELGKGGPRHLMSGRKKTRSKVKSPCCVAKMAVRIPTHSILRMAGQNELAGAYSWEAKCRRLVGGLTNQRKIGGEPFFMRSPDLIFRRIVFQIGIRRFLCVVFTHNF